jgi:ferrous-iron efflux pump FieF
MPGSDLMQAEADTTPTTDADRGRLVRSASTASVAVAALLVGLKTWAWLDTGSVSLLSSLADSLLDVAASLLTFWAVRFSLSPPDAEHRFGHGKSEGLAALLQALVIGGSGLFVCVQAVDRLIRPVPIQSPAIGIGVVLVATVLSLALVAYQRWVTKRTGSVAIEGDSLHYGSDVAVNLSVAAAIFLVTVTGWNAIDPLTGLAVALWIFYSSWQLGGRALDILLDREIPDADRDRIRAIALDHPDVIGVHDLRTRHGGANFIVQFHLDLERDTSLVRAHEIQDEVEDRIRAEYHGCEIIIHVDPCGIDERRDRFEEEAKGRSSAASTGR